MTRLVIADDHAFLRAGLEAVLSSHGYEIVASVADGSAALAAVERDEPDVVILDVRMPQMSGLEALEAMRVRNSNLRVILLTAELEEAGLVAALRAKVDGIVFKDWAISRLEDAIQAVLSGARFIDMDLVDRAIAKAMERPAKRLASLTARERQIVDCVASGKRNKEIAEEIGITEGTVKIHLHRIYEKLNVSNRTELALLA